MGLALKSHLIEFPCSHTLVMKSIPLLILFATGAHASVLFYDSQSASSVYNNTSYNASGLTYTMANSQALPVNDGKRVTNGLGDSGGNDYFSLTLSAGDAWDQAGLYDSGSQTVGGGSVSGSVYMGILVRAQNPAGGTSENKSGAVQGTYAAFQLGRPSVTTLGVGNYWSAWAYSIFGVAGDRDLILVPVVAHGSTTILLRTGWSRKSHLTREQPMTSASGWIQIQTISTASRPEFAATRLQPWAISALTNLPIAAAISVHRVLGNSMNPALQRVGQV